MNAVLAYVNASDDRISGRFREWTPPGWVRWWMLAASRLGDGWLWASIGFVLLDGAGRWRRAIAAAALAAALVNVILVLSKRRFQRLRPCDVAPHPAFDVKVSHFLRYIPSDRFSFPSGHAANAFTLATILGLTFPWTASFALVVAASVATSRMILGLHFLSDVIVGALLGFAVAALSYLVVMA